MSRMVTTEKKERTRFAIVGAIVIVVIVAISVAGVVVLRSPQGRALQALADAADKSEKRPGALVLRAQGCRQVIVLSYEELRALGMQVDEAAAALATLEVICNGAPAARTCNDFAQAFAKAEGAALRGVFHLVANDDDDRPQCTGYFDAQGAPMGPAIVR